MENPGAKGNIQEGYVNRLKSNWDQGEYGRLLQIVRKSIPVVIALLLLSIIVAYAIVRWTSPIYESKSILQLGQNDTANKILEVNQIFEEDDLFAELEFLRSRLLVEKTIENLPLAVRYFTEGKLLTHEKYPDTFYTVDSLTVKNGDVYGKKIYIDFIDNETYNLTIGETHHNNLKVGNLHDFPQLKLRVFFDKVNIGLSESTYFMISSREMLVNEFVNKLKVSPFNARAKSIIIQAQGQNPRLVKDFVNAHVESFMQYGQIRQSRSAENILTFIDNQLDTVSKNLQDAEQLLSSFRSKNKINGSTNTAIFDNLNNYDSESVELDFQSSILKEVGKLVSNEDQEIDVYNLVALSVGSDYESVLSGMLKELGDLLRRKEEIKYKVTDDSEPIKSLDFQIDIQKKLVAESVVSLQKKLNNKKVLLDKKKKLLEGQFVSLPSKEVELARYQRLFNISEKYYNLLLEKRTEYKISKAGYVSKNKVLSRARYEMSPISPKPKAIYAIALMLGLILGIIFTLTRYLSYNKINSVNDIIKHSGASIGILGIVPEDRQNDGSPVLRVHEGTKTILAESLRSIKTNLNFVAGKGNCNTIAITSTVSGEGKTFVSINLGAVMSLANKKILIVDLDLRKPKIHSSFGVDNKAGLSSILAGMTEFRDCIRKSDLPNLDFITSGPIPPNPFELLNGDDLKILIEKMSEEYDTIIFDTPPVGLVSDGFSILRIVDCPIYIFRNEVSKINFIHNLDRLTHENGLSKISALLNGVSSRSSSYGRNYGYGYGYGYVNNGKHANEYFETTTKKPWWKRS